MPVFAPTSIPLFPALDVPFKERLHPLFFDDESFDKDGLDEFPIHGPNVIRFSTALMGTSPKPPGLFFDDGAEGVWLDARNDVRKALELPTGQDAKKKEKELAERISLYALYHDIGKQIRRANHPRIGVNLLLHSDDEERRKLIDLLRDSDEKVGEGGDEEARGHSRFTSLCSVVEHHDKFGVVSTGEGALPIFSDILYFTSDASERALAGARRNITSVMMMNLADIAAVCMANENDRKNACSLARKLRPLLKDEPTKEADEVTLEYRKILENPRNCLGLAEHKVRDVVDDWKTLMESLNAPDVRGDRNRLKMHLIALEQNPARTIRRIRRLLLEALLTTNARELTNFVTPVDTEAVLVGSLGSHGFRDFCERYARAVKLDYGLNFFKSIVCHAVRRQICKKTGGPLRLTDEERDLLSGKDGRAKRALADDITAIFVRVLASLVNRYSDVLSRGDTLTDARRFGFQMRNLTQDQGVRESIVEYLIDSKKDFVALTWIADEVTVWSLD